MSKVTLKWERECQDRDHAEAVAVTVDRLYGNGKFQVLETSARKGDEMNHPVNEEVALYLDSVKLHLENVMTNPKLPFYIARKLNSLLVQVALTAADLKPTSLTRAGKKWLAAKNPEQYAIPETAEEQEAAS